MNPYRIELRAGRDWLLRRHFWWVLIHANGQTLATSETYTTYAAALDTARGVATALGISL